EAQYVGHARHEIRQRLTLRKPHQMRRAEPTLEELWPARTNLFVRVPLPRAVVQIVEIIEDRRLQLTGGTNRRCGLQAAPQWARVDRHGVALQGEPLSRGVCLPGTEVRELDVAASAEALRGHSFDVPMPHQDDARHETYGSRNIVQATNPPLTGA